MAIQHRRGADVDFKPDRMKAGELALTTDGTRKMYAAFAPGDVKEVAFKEDIPEGGGGGSFEQVQADYAQTDSTQPDYIKNRPFYEGYALVLESTFETVAEDGSFMAVFEGVSFDPNNPFDVTWDGVEYKDVNKVIGQGMCYFGNTSLVTGGEDTGEPFLGIYVEGMGIQIMSITDTEATEHDIKIGTITMKKIDEKYLPTGAKMLFYGTSGNKLYLLKESSNLNAKITAEELQEWLNSGRLSFVCRSDWERYCILGAHHENTGTLEYGYVLFKEYDVGLTEEPELKIAYTAEYTP